MTIQLLATLASIGVLTALAWVLHRAVLPRLCPLCAGVAGTWISLLAAHGVGVALDPRLPALLLGGTVVGLAGLGEAAWSGRPPGAVLAWKTAFVTLGFATAYALLLGAWPGAVLGGLALALLGVLPWLVRPASADKPITDAQARLQAELKNCC